MLLRTNKIQQLMAQTRIFSLLTINVLHTVISIVCNDKYHDIEKQNYLP